MRYVFIVLCLTACTAERQPWDLFGSVEEESELVVDGVLLVNHDLPDLFVRRTLPLAAAVRHDSSYVFDPADIDSTGRLVRPSYSTYSRDAAGVTGAQVRVVQGAQVFEYAPDPAWPGRYLPPEAPRVEALTEYRLEVEVKGKRVRARTTTPDRMRVRQTVLIDEETLEVLRTLKSFAEAGDGVYTAPENQLTYLEGLLEIHLDTGTAKGYQLALITLEPILRFVDDDIEDFYDEEDEHALRANESPPLSVSAGIVRLPWLAVVFEGRTLVKMYALDHNWFEYARSSPNHQERGGFGGLAGDQFERPFFQVEGGIGLFGSAAVDSVGFVVLPRP